MAALFLLVTAIFSKNLYILWFALAMLVALRLPGGIRFKEIAFAVLLGVIVGSFHYILRDSSHTDDNYYLDSIRLVGILMIIVVCIRYMDSFSAIEWLEISAFFPIPETLGRPLVWMVVFILMTTRFIGMFIGIAFKVFVEFKTRPQLSAKHSIDIIPGMALTYVTEVLRNVEVYSDTWDLRFGSPVLQTINFKRSLNNIDYFAVLILVIFIILFTNFL